METHEYAQEIETRADPAAVLSVASEIHNLPRWTLFFTSVDGPVERGYAVTTRLGAAVTWIEHSGSDVYICSELQGRLEKARLSLQPSAAGTRIAFHTQLPLAWGEERIAAQLGMMTRELERLRGLCEASGDGISA
jgi:hypothetical protein